MELIEQIAVYTRDLVLLYELRPDDPALLLALANQHAAAGEEALAEQYLSRFNETIVDVDNIDVTQSLADYWTSRRRWPQAAQALRAIADQSPEMNISWLNAGPVIALAGDPAAYHDFCRAMLAAAVGMEQTLKVCLLLPDVVPPEELPAQRLEEYLTAGEPRAQFRPWGYAALAAWRSHDAEAALEWSRRSLESDPIDPRAKATALVLQSMARHAQGELAAAHESLAQAAALIDPALEQWQPDSLPGLWHDWLIADILRREAEGVIGEEDED